MEIDIDMSVVAVVNCLASVFRSIKFLNLDIIKDICIMLEDLLKA